MTLDEHIAEAVRRAVAETVPRAVEQALRELLPQHGASAPASPVDDERLTVREVATRFKKDMSTVRRWARDGRLPCLSVNGRPMFRREDVEAFERGARACATQPPDPNVVAIRMLKR